MCPWLDNFNFQKKFSNVYCHRHFYALLMMLLILWEIRGTKNRNVCVVFQSKYYVKISSMGNEV